MAVKILYTGNALKFKQTLTTNIKYERVRNYLHLRQRVHRNLKPVSVINRLNMTQLIHVAKTYNLSLGNVIIFNDAAHHRVFDLVAGNIIQFFGSTDRPNTSPVDHLSFQQSVTVDVSKGARNKLNLSQSVTVTVIKAISVGNTLSMQQSAVQYKPRLD
jgi:hypothetical protein